MKIAKINDSNQKTILIDKIAKLKADAQISMILGDYKIAKNSYRELAKIGVDNFELVAKAPNAIQGSIPLFSKYGLRIIGYKLYELFSHEMPEERKFKEMGKLFKKGILRV